MHGKNLVAVFPSVQSAEEARARLISSGIDKSYIRLSAEGKAHKSGKSARPVEEPGFFEWLFGAEIPDREREWYGNTLRDGRTALSVRAIEQSDLTAIENILSEAGALELDQEGEDLTGAVQKTASGFASKSQRKSVVETDEEVIPVVNEEIAVGKRTTERRRLIRTHVIERPIQETVQLNDETVIVERRPASGRGAHVGEPEAREYEIIERHEEPVVQKRARTVEEVVVKKNVRSRTETVNDTVRETEVEVEGKIVPKTSKQTSTKKTV